jgi:hypothetical protein
MVASGFRRLRFGFALMAMSALAAATRDAPLPSTRLADGSNGGDWAAFGRTFGEQHSAHAGPRIPAPAGWDRRYPSRAH